MAGSTGHPKANHHFESPLKKNRHPQVYATVGEIHFGNHGSNHVWCLKQFSRGIEKFQNFLSAEDLVHPQYQNGHLLSFQTFHDLAQAFVPCRDAKRKRHAEVGARQDGLRGNPPKASVCLVPFQATSEACQREKTRFNPKKVVCLCSYFKQLVLSLQPRHHPNKPTT